MSEQLKALIIGYGRAGRRHGAALDRVGVEWDTVEPDSMVAINSGLNFNKRGFWDLKDALSLRVYNFAVIATPPALHLAQIRQCLDAGLAVLCEKPLAGFGQLAEAEALLDHPQVNRVMMAFNYRFHPALVQVKRTQEQWTGQGFKWACFSDQYRPNLPEWGLLLDHVSHSIDILLWLTGADTLDIEIANHHEAARSKSWFVRGMAGSQPFNIWEGIRPDPIKKLAYVGGPFGFVPVATSQPIVEQMTMDMYKVFLAHLAEGQPFPVGLEAGVRVQRVLEQIREAAGQ